MVATLVERWNVANRSDLNADQTWRQYDGAGAFGVRDNAAAMITRGGETASCAARMDGPDFWAEIDITSWSGDGTWHGVFVRSSHEGGQANHQDGYVYEVDYWGNGYVWKRWGGARTTIHAGSARPGGATNQTGTARIEIRGSTIRTFWNGQLHHTLTDTQIVGDAHQRYVALYGHVDNEPTFWRVNELRAATFGQANVEIREPFTKGDTSDLSTGLTVGWTKMTRSSWSASGDIRSNRLTAWAQGVLAGIRADRTLSSGDMRAELTVWDWDSTTRNVGVMARVDSNNTALVNAYIFEIRPHERRYWLWKVGGGGGYYRESVYIPENIGWDFFPGMKIGIEVHGSTIRALINGMVLDTWTDTGISAHVDRQRAGVMFYNPQLIIKADDFTASAATGIVAVQKAHTFTEGFDGPLDPLEWPIAPPVDTYWLHRNAAFHLATPAYGSFVSKRLDLTDSHVSVRCHVASDAQINGIETFFMLRENTNNELLFIQTGNQLLARVKSAGVNQDKSTVFSGTMHAYRRIRHAGSTIYFETSDNGVDWVVFHSQVLAWRPTNVDIGLQAGNWNSAGGTPNKEVWWDRVNLTDPGPWPQYASDEPWREFSNGASRPIKEDKSWEDNPIVIRGVTHPKGFGCHAFSEMYSWVPPGARTFAATVGINDEVPADQYPPNATVQFEVWDGGGTRLHQSPVLNRQSDPHSFSVGVQHTDQLRLIVRDVEGNVSYDHGDWGSARYLAGNDLFLSGSLRVAGVATRRLYTTFASATAPTAERSFRRVVPLVFTSALTATGAMARALFVAVDGATQATGVLARRTPMLVKRGDADSSGRITIVPNIDLGGTVPLAATRLLVGLGAVFMRAGDAIMRLRAAGEARMRFRRR